MVWPGVSPLVYALLAGSLASAGVAVYAWRRTATPARVPFVGMTGTDAVWTALYAVTLTAPPTTVRLALEGLYLVAGMFVGVWWLLFGLAYTGRTEWVSVRTGALLSTPAILLLVSVAVDPTVSALYSGEPAVLGGVTALTMTSRTPLFFVLVTYLFGTIGVGFALVLRHVTADHSVYSGQTAWIVLGSLPAVVAGVMDTFGLGPADRVHLVPFTIPLVMVGFGVALFRYDMTGVTPATGRVGRDAALRDLADPVVVTDGQGRVADCNPAAVEIFGVVEGEAAGRDLHAALGAPPDTTLEDGSLVTLHTTEGRRQLEVSASTVSDDAGRPVGRALVFRDVTRRELREQRLEVLNRVVRHNLRNDMNVVVGHTELLGQHVEAADGGGRHLDQIRDIAGELVDLGEKAHAFEETVTQETNPRPVVLRELVEHVLDGLDPHDGSVSVDVPPDLTVVTDGTVLELVLENVVENAIEHAGESPSVTVRAGREEADVRIVVADDGPGIPESERRVLESGEESPLQHGSGLGLWIADWGTRWLGGSVTIDCEDGTRVGLRLPDGEPMPDSGTGPRPGDAPADGGTGDPATQADGGRPRREGE